MVNACIQAIAEWTEAEQDWRPVSPPALLAWLGFYLVFLVYAFRMHGAFLFIDFPNLVVHEAGHLLFGWFGPTLMIWGGTVIASVVRTFGWAGMLATVGWLLCRGMDRATERG